MQTATKILQPFLWAAVNLLALQMEEFLHMQVMSIGIGPQQKDQQEKYQQQKVLATLQKIILLARFFPNQHAIHSAGKKLLRVGPPLLFNNNSGIKSSLLHYYFQVLLGLQLPPVAALQQLLHDRVTNLEIEFSGVSSCNTAAKNLHIPLNATTALLTAVMKFCAYKVEPSTVFMSPNKSASQLNSDLIALLQGDMYYQMHSLFADQKRDVATYILRPYCDSLLEALIENCIKSVWSLTHFSSSVLPHLCNNLQKIAQFLDNNSMHNSCMALEATLITLHACNDEPAADTLDRLLVLIFRLRRGEEISAALLAWQAILSGAEVEVEAEAVEYEKDKPHRMDETMAAVFVQEVQLYQCYIQNFLLAVSPKSQTAAVSQDLLTWFYKLQWICLAVKCPQLSGLCGCFWQFLLQHWYHKLALGAATLQVLQTFCTRLESMQTPMENDVGWWQLQNRLLRLWPALESKDEMPILLLDKKSKNAIYPDGLITLARVPQLLSGAFTALVNANRHWFVSYENLTAHRIYLQQELLLLERGAAAMRLPALEQLCTLLLELHSALDDYADAETFPAELLWSTHQLLLNMLDQAAAWQDPELDMVLVSRLQSWLGQTVSCDKIQLQEPPPLLQPSWLQLSNELTRQVKILAAMMELPVRMVLAQPSMQLSVPTLQLLEQSLRPLLKFIMLDSTQDGNSRSAVHKPVINSINISVQAQHQALVVIVEQDSHEPPPPRLLKTLQHKLPRAAGKLTCAVNTGTGRTFRISFSCL